MNERFEVIKALCTVGHEIEDGRVTFFGRIGELADAVLAARPAAEVVAYMWQHDETGRIGFVDKWQIENGFEASNPRLKLIGPLCRAPAAIGGNSHE